MSYFVFDILHEHKCVAVFCRLHDQLPAQGELDDDIMIRLIALPRVIGLPPELQCLGPLEGG